jgi:hypothetical protein
MNQEIEIKHLEASDLVRLRVDNPYLPKMLRPRLFCAHRTSYPVRTGGREVKLTAPVLCA